MWKQSKHVKKWNRRYFVLWPAEANPKKGRLLFYYTTPQVRPATKFSMFAYTAVLTPLANRRTKNLVA
jgi:hypothetical protein